MKQKILPLIRPHQIIVDTPIEHPNSLIMKLPVIQLKILIINNKENKSGSVFWLQTLRIHSLMSINSHFY